MNKPKKFVRFFLIGLFSAIASLGIFYWLYTIQANTTLKIVTPSVIFISCFAGLWLLYNFIRVLFFQKKGVHGYKLRGKITTNFLLSTLGFIVVFGGLMFYLIFLIENTFLDKERNVAYNVMQGYRNMIDFRKKDFEQKQNILLSVKPEEFPMIFTLQGGKITYLQNRSTVIAKSITYYRNNIEIYFSKPKNRFLYIGNTSSFIVAKRGKYYYANWTEKKLTDAFIILKSNADTLYRLRLLKQYIIPVSILSIFILTIPILIGAFFVSLFLARNITGPIEEIAKGTRIIANGDLDYKVHVNTRDEIGDLAYHFNSMASKLKSAKEQIKRIERLEAWQEMAKRLAHEVKNPLTPIKLSAERLVYSYDNKPADFPAILSKTTTTIINETKRLENLVNEFSRFARLPNLRLETRNLMQTVNEVLVFFDNAYHDFRIENLITHKEVVIPYDENQVKQVLINILNNAMDAYREGEKAVTIDSEEKDGKFILAFRDRGAGVNPEVREKIFEPYFTTKEHGSGLGLAIAERIMLEHGGNIWFDTSEEGTTFFVEFPMNVKEGEIDEIQDPDSR